MRRLLPLLLLLAALAPLHAAAPARPNLVVFLIDDMGVMDSSVPFLTDANGRPQRHPLNEFYRTPAMERLAARGVRFSHFSAMSVCSPTRISIQNGQNAARHRTTNWINPNTDNAGPQGPAEWNWRGLRRGDVTLARLLQQAGYRTLHVGKGHFGPVGTEGADPLNLGFDVNVGGAAFGAPGTYYAKDGFGKNNAKRASSAVPGLDAYHGSETFLTEALTLEAKREVRFYAEQSEALATFIRLLGLALSIIFSIGAVVGAMITMFASVASRTGEIGTLRALGFRRSAVLTAFLGEALLLALVGGIMGLAGASLMQSVDISTVNFQTFSELAFRFRLTPAIAVQSIAFALLMGLVGGFIPAWRAARMKIVDCLRAA